MNYAQPDGASGVLSVLFWLSLVVLPGMGLLSLVWLVGAARSSSVSHVWFSALGGEAFATRAARLVEAPFMRGLEDEGARFL